METKIKGTRDYFGNESLRLQKTISILEEVANTYSLEKVVSPTFEKTEIFSRAVGNETDVVNKEMYTFEDRKGRSISLKPEGTASVVRLALENKLLDNNQQLNAYYISSMFRYERPQKGRQREFFQFGVEIFNRDSIYIDLEVIKMANDILNKMNISKYELQINSIGNSGDRSKYNEALKSFVESKLDSLSDYAKEKYTSGNIMRIFDSKIESDLEALTDAPSINDYISAESKDKLNKLEELLTNNNIKYVINEKLVRGLDYYNDVVFEFVSTDIDNLGSKSTIIGGGRYDYLINKVDESKDIPAIGFAIGIERLMLAATDFLDKSVESKIDYYVAAAYDEDKMKEVAFKVADSFRNKGKSVITDFSKKKLPKKFELAEKANSTYVVIVGNEIENETITIKNIKDGSSQELNIKEI